MKRPRREGETPWKLLASLRGSRYTALAMSLVSSAAVLAAIASVSLGGCASSGTSRTQTMSPASMYRLCRDVQFQCVPADLQTVPASTEPAPLQVDTNLAAPSRNANLG